MPTLKAILTACKLSLLRVLGLVKWLQAGISYSRLPCYTVYARWHHTPQGHSWPDRKWRRRRKTRKRRSRVTFVISLGRVVCSPNVLLALLGVSWQDERNTVMPGGKITNERRKTRDMCVHKICMINSEGLRRKGIIFLVYNTECITENEGLMY